MTDKTKYTIQQHKSIKYALEKINSFTTGQALILFVVDNEGQIIGSITDGDIRRGLTSGATIDTTVDKIMRKDFRYIKNLNNYKKINKYKNLDLKIVPHVSEDYHLIDFIDLTKLKAVIPADAVIMAGGKGVRLKPYTNDTPKPMLELAGKPILAHNIDRLLAYGIKNIYISVNHLKEQIISYVKENYKGVNIQFIEEKQPLGTIGSIKLVKEWENDDILVMNADVLTNIDFLKVF